MRKIIFLLSTLLCIQGFAQRTEVVQIGEDIQLIKLTENTFIHRSFKVFEEYGRVPCNGLVYIADSSCVIFDTPVTTKSTLRLLDHLTLELGYQVDALVVNHFHEDCTAGLDSVHARGIPTYGHRKTARLSAARGWTSPEKKFGNKKVMKLGDRKIVNYHAGPGHTIDNIVSYLPEERVLFGGCLIKAQHAGKGNLADADTDKWSATVAKVKKKFPEVEHVVPGHGHPGGVELLDYTIDLFQTEEQ